jgi:hypothetical protein
MQNDLFYWSNHPVTPVDEILLGGRRGPGKTAALTMWLAELVGNPKYIGLILREEAEALKEWIEKEGWPLYSKLGGKKKGRPVEFHFACPGAGEWAVHKAIIFTGHLRDLGSVEQGRGHEYHRIGIEESTQIANEELYLRLFGSNRSTVPGISPKICNTANPDGPGNSWHQSRWIKVYARQRMELGNGRTEEVTVQIPPRQPFRDPVTGRIRIYIPGTITENTILLKIDGITAHAWLRRISEGVD